jgi:hypothetical protein
MHPSPAKLPGPPFSHWHHILNHLAGFAQQPILAIDWETNSATINALQFRPDRLRHRARILRGPVSRADDRLGVLRERY